MGANNPMPFSNIQYFITVGIYSSTDKTTGAAGVCTASLTGESTLLIIGDSSTNTNCSATAVSPKQSFNGLIAHLPLIHPYTKDVPDDILQMVYKPDDYTACLQNVSVNGKKYVRLGDILIPE